MLLLKFVRNILNIDGFYIFAKQIYWHKTCKTDFFHSFRFFAASVPLVTPSSLKSSTTCCFHFNYSCNFFLRKTAHKDLDCFFFAKPHWLYFLRRFWVTFFFPKWLVYLLFLLWGLTRGSSFGLLQYLISVFYFKVTLFLTCWH